MKFITQARDAIATDHTIQRVRRDGARMARSLPYGTLNYVVEKVPVVFWLPKYNPRWVVNDVLAGITVGALLIPQSLAYAKIATISGEFGLMSSWLPGLIYFFMGTSKDLSTGPTSLMGLLTAEIIEEISHEGYSPQAIASAVAMSVGIYSLVLGLFKLGFLLEFVSIPVLSGFISATGIVIMLGQIPSLFGVKVGSGTANIIHDLFAKIPQFKPATIGVGFGGLFLLVALEKIGAKWGKKNKVIWYIALARSAVVLILFTGISYGVNKDRVDDPVWELSKVKSKGIAAPLMPDTTLLGKVFVKAIVPFIAAGIEHLAIAKSFGRKNSYTIDAAQELVYLGVTNFFNSFFSSMPVGGAMSRTAVGSATGVKSPASGLIAGSFVVLAIFKLSPALFWIPKATLASIIVVAVWGIISPPSVFYQYWKTSLVDFTAAMISFWVTLFAGTEYGVGAAVGFNIVYYLLFWAFARVRRIQNITVPSPGSQKYKDDTEYKSQLSYYHGNGEEPIPLDAAIFRPTQSMIFLNAYHVKQAFLDTVQTYHAGTCVSHDIKDKDRIWSVSGARRLTLLRRKAKIDADSLTQIRVVVLDMSMVEAIDTTGLTALKDFKEDLEVYAGKAVEVRFLGIRSNVRDVFERFGWGLVDTSTLAAEGEPQDEKSKVYEALGQAAWERKDMGMDHEDEIMILGNEKV